MDESETDDIENEYIMRQIMSDEMNADLSTDIYTEEYRSGYRNQSYHRPQSPNHAPSFGYQQFTSMMGHSEFTKNRRYKTPRDSKDSRDSKIKRSRRRGSRRRYTDTDRRNRYTCSSAGSNIESNTDSHTKSCINSNTNSCMDSHTESYMESYDESYGNSYTESYTCAICHKDKCDHLIKDDEECDDDCDNCPNDCIVGPQGPQGSQGPPGTGSAGPQGPQGPMGPPRTGGIDEIRVPSGNNAMSVISPMGPITTLKIRGSCSGKKNETIIWESLMPDSVSNPGTIVVPFTGFVIGCPGVTPGSFMAFIHSEPIEFVNGNINNNYFSLKATKTANLLTNGGHINRFYYNCLTTKRDFQLTHINEGNVTLGTARVTPSNSVNVFELFDLNTPGDIGNFINGFVMGPYLCAGTDL